MARRYIAGTGQIVLALIGFGFVVAWFVGLANQIYQLINGDETERPIAWLGETGAVVFAAAWIWSLFTSMSVMREARANQPVPPIQNHSEPGLSTGRMPPDSDHDR